MKKLAIIPVLIMVGCASVNTDVTDFYAIEGGCASKTYYLAEAYKYQAPNKPVNDRVTTYEYVCKQSGQSANGKDVKTFDDFKAIQNSNDITVKAIFISEGQARKMKFRHLFKG